MLFINQLTAENDRLGKVTFYAQLYVNGKLTDFVIDNEDMKRVEVSVNEWFESDISDPKAWMYDSSSKKMDDMYKDLGLDLSRTNESTEKKDYNFVYNLESSDKNRAIDLYENNGIYMLQLLENGDYVKNFIFEDMFEAEERANEWVSNNVDLNEFSNNLIKKMNFKDFANNINASDNELQINEFKRLSGLK